MSEHIEEQSNLVENSDKRQPGQFRAKYAGFWIRFWAYTIDLLVIAAISGIVVKPIFRVAHIDISSPSFLLFSPYKITALLLLLLYFTMMTKFLQQTVGKMIMGIKVVSENGDRLSWSSVLFREVVGRFISKTLVLPYLLVLFMPKKEALHDLFADTIVIHEQTYEKEMQVSYQNQNDLQKLQSGSVI
ncbi:RDD family protein [Filibacter tadaridae]|uniref:RDD family protein n=1 Tax=Filibacter tadaridae TaxID=2483811 RepID=A0A3P5XGS9_9BACL|nr:RDD family protein [Filibacter tadaridae]VDC26786.1 RDD family protein [Filibacter tadaridae]